MTRQKNSPQKKEEETVPIARDLINTTISKMSELEIRMTIIQTLAGFEKSMEDNRESLTVEIKELKYNQAKIKNAITEMQ